MEIYSTKDATGTTLRVHKEQVGPNVTAYFIDVSTPCCEQRCALSATSVLNLGRALLSSVHDDAQEPAPEMPQPPIPPTLHAVE